VIFDSFRHQVLDDLGGNSSGGGNGAYNLTATAVHGKDNPDPFPVLAGNLDGILSNLHLHGLLA